MPENNVLIVNGATGIRFNPCRQTLRGLAGGLRNVATGRMDLVVGI
jgi:hypothetical protein